ncbi:MAG: trigger factor [Minisyncoccia bacterium]
MESTTKKLPDSKVKLSVRLDKAELLEFVEEAEKILASETHLEGFRPGKAPKEIVRKRIGEDKIKEEALSIAIRSSFAEAIKKEKLDVIDQADFKIGKNTPDCLEYEMVLSVFPAVVLGKYTGLNIKENKIAVTEDEIKKTLDELVKMQATAKTTDRPAKAGNRVEVNFEIFSEGKLIDGGKSENHPLVIGEKKFIPGFEEQIVGMQTGEKKSFAIQVPADYVQKEIAGKEIKIDLELVKVEELLVPVLDDGFAKSLGKFADLTALKENLKKSLEAEKEAKEKDRVRLAILSEIVGKSQMELPATLVEERLDSMIRDFDEDLHQKGMELGLYLAHLKKTQDDLRNDWRQKAEQQVKMSMVARTIARQEKIEVNDEDIEKEFATLSDYYTRQGMLEDLKQSDPLAIRSRIKDVLLNEKVFDFLEKNNVQT